MHTKLNYLLICVLLTMPYLLLAQQDNNMPELGVCATVDKASLIKKYGYTFIQPTVTEVLQPLKPDSLYKITNIAKAPDVPIMACNGFLPGAIKVTGPQANEAIVVEYATSVFRRARELKIPLIVFGSSGARQIPEGYNRDTARKQFIAISKRLAELAAKYNITLALESLNRQECNFINTLKEAVEIAKEVNHPNFLVTVDIYHMMRENEPAANIVAGGKYIYHCDIAEQAARTPPGVAGEDFVPYFRALQSIGYKGKIALECKIKNWEEELPLAIETIHKQWRQAAIIK